MGFDLKYIYPLVINYLLSDIKIDQYQKGIISYILIKMREVRSGARLYLICQPFLQNKFLHQIQMKK